MCLHRFRHSSCGSDPPAKPLRGFCLWLTVQLWGKLSTYYVDFKRHARRVINPAGLDTRKSATARPSRPSHLARALNSPLDLISRFSSQPGARQLHPFQNVEGLWRSTPTPPVVLERTFLDESAPSSIHPPFALSLLERWGVLCAALLSWSCHDPHLAATARTALAPSLLAGYLKPSEERRSRARLQLRRGAVLCCAPGGSAALGPCDCLPLPLMSTFHVPQLVSSRLDSLAVHDIRQHSVAWLVERFGEKFLPNLCGLHEDLREIISAGFRPGKRTAFETPGKLLLALAQVAQLHASAPPLERSASAAALIYLSSRSSPGAQQIFHPATFVDSLFRHYCTRHYNGFRFGRVRKQRPGVWVWGSFWGPKFSIKGDYRTCGINTGFRGDLALNPCGGGHHEDGTFAIIRPSRFGPTFLTDDFFFRVSPSEIYSSPPHLARKFLQTAKSKTDCSEYPIILLSPAKVLQTALKPAFSKKLFKKNARGVSNTRARLAGPKNPRNPVLGWGEFWANSPNQVVYKTCARSTPGFRPPVGALSSVFDQMTSQRQHELATVLVGYLKLNNKTACQGDSTFDSSWISINFGRFSRHITYSDLKEMKINGMTVLNSLPATLKAELIFDPSNGVLQNETLIRMVLSSILISPDDGQLEQFFTAFTDITTKRNITVIENTAVRDTMLNLTLMALAPKFPLFQTNDYMLWFQMNLVVLLASFRPSNLVVIPTNLSCDSYDAILKGLENALAVVPSEHLEDLKTSKEILILSQTKGCPQKNTPLPVTTTDANSITWAVPMESSTIFTDPSSVPVHFSSKTVSSATDSKSVTTATTSSVSTTQLSAKAFTGPAVPGEVFVILQIRLHIQYIDAYNNPALLEYQTLSRNITMELNRFYWQLYEPHFLRCYLLRFWPGSVGVDVQLIFKNDTGLPNATSIEDDLKSAVVESKVFLDIIPSSIIVVRQDGSTLTTKQTQSSQNVLIIQTSSTLTANVPILSADPTYKSSTIASPGTVPSQLQIIQIHQRHLFLLVPQLLQFLLIDHTQLFLPIPQPLKSLHIFQEQLFLIIFQMQFPVINKAQLFILKPQSRQSGTTVSVSSAAGNHITTSVIFANSTHSKITTTSTTSSLQTTHLSTKASTGSAVPGEGFVILQIRLQRQYIDAYNNPASMEYQILSTNITIELNRIYREMYGVRFLRCYVIRFWPGSVGVDTELIFKNQTVLPNATSIEESLTTAIAESKVFLGVIPSSIIVVEQQDSTSTTRQTQTTQSVPIMQTSSAVAPVLSSMLFMLLLLLWNETIRGVCLDEMWKHSKSMIPTVGRQNRAGNGPEWGEMDEIDSEDLMDVSQGSGKIREK
ncbi:hypothetical protein QQF64_034349 [Cirrhinus molitorella]|uniref:SEA domain-containing protein n=1 Tax=Cirrhinus molitorella TaxID=172907 RepID=A0ABR3L1I0_9TELE